MILVIIREIFSLYHPLKKSIGRYYIFLMKNLVPIDTRYLEV